MRAMYKICVVLGIASVISSMAWAVVVDWGYPGRNVCDTVRYISGNTPPACRDNWGPFWLLMASGLGWMVLALILGTRTNRKIGNRKNLAENPRAARL